MVSEILGLRRDQEEKLKIIEGLEINLHESRGIHEALEASVAGTAKENRVLQKQLSLLEGGSSTALADLTRERNEAVESGNDVRRRLELAQKKIRSQEEDEDRTHQLWAQDKENWQDDKRKLERRIHVAEARLKTVLDEFEALQASLDHHAQPEEPPDKTPRGHESDAGSVRTMSLTNSIRFSMLSGANGHLGSKGIGLSLADELDLDDEEETLGLDGRESVQSNKHMRNQSYESFIARAHHRHPSMESPKRPSSGLKTRIPVQLYHDSRASAIFEDEEVNHRYTDAAVQTSAITSVLCVSRALQTDIEPVVYGNGLAQDMSAGILGAEAVTNSPVSHAMVSVASQTSYDDSDSPRPHDQALEEARASKSYTTCTGTQTDVLSPPPRRAPPPPPIDIPSIQLHPPRSAPGTPRLPLLPQHLKEAACQVNLGQSLSTRSISIQTEEIRVDARLNLLPRHLQPSSISSRPNSPDLGMVESKSFSPGLGGFPPPRNPRRLHTQARDSLDSEIPSSPPVAIRDSQDSYAGYHEDLPLDKGKGSIKRPPRLSSLFAGFENVSSDEGEDYDDVDMSDGEYRTGLTAAPHAKPQMSRQSKSVWSAPLPVPEESDSAVQIDATAPSTTANDPVEPQDDALAIELGQARRESLRLARQLDKPLSVVTSAKPTTMRRSTLIQNGVTAHHSRARSPSLPDSITEPPFPIPTRASSRRPPISASAPSDGTRSPTLGRAPLRHGRTGSIRKVRSATALHRAGGSRYRRRGSRSPPPFTPSTEAPESPGLPPLPRNEISHGHGAQHEARYRRHRQQPSDRTANTARTQQTIASSSTNPGTSVVDAIAQTMIGEWMFKYVRRRKSFGVPDVAGMESETSNGARHKRWVWLAPYERAVMWSSKQPTSGSALLGKSGRKRKMKLKEVESCAN